MKSFPQFFFPQGGNLCLHKKYNKCYFLLYIILLTLTLFKLNVVLIPLYGLSHSQLNISFLERKFNSGYGEHWYY